MDKLNPDSLRAQIHSLQQQLREVESAERLDAIRQARGIILRYKLTVEDLFPSLSGKVGRVNARRPAPAKYFDPATGTYWSGRGLTPVAFRGKNLTEYLIKEDSQGGDSRSTETATA